MDKKDIILYQAEDGKISVDVNIKDETIWLNLNQIAELFGRDKSVISRHIRNIYKDEELNRSSTVAFFATVQNEGGREIERNIEFYNLDLIISVGYRVNSKRGTQFRIWATNLLKQHLINGYTINEKRLKEQTQKLFDLQNTIKILERTIENQVKELDEAKGLLKVISDYSYALTILDEYDHQDVKMRDTTKREAYILSYEEAVEVINSMKTEFSTGLLS